MNKAFTDGIESRELQKVARALTDYIMEDLSRWYLHLIRDRSWDEESTADKTASYYMLHRAIMSTAVALAPICPHISEKVYRAMDGEKLSVHMEDWQKADMSLVNEDLEHSMHLIQNIIEIVATERGKMGSKLRWPLKAIYNRGMDAKVNAAVKVFDEVLAQQGNIKSVDYLPEGGEVIGKDDVEPVPFDEGEIFIDFEITPEIEAEGYARELIRRIQQMRKDMKLNVDEYINVDVKAEPHLVDLFKTWQDHISAEVRAKQIEYTDEPAGDSVKDWDITGKNITSGGTSSKICRGYGRGNPAVP